MVSRSRTARAVPALLVLVLVVTAAPAFAAFPGRNGWIATEQSEGEDFLDYDLVAVSPAGRRERELGGFGSAPAVGPAGLKYAYAGEARNSDDRESAYRGIWLARWSGRGPGRRITRGADSSPTFAPDYHKLAFVRRGSQVRVYHRRRTRRLAAGHSPAWSVTNWIAFETPRRWIDLIRPNGSRRRRLVRGGQPDWSPDASRIAFTHPGGGIATIRASGGGLLRITRSGHDPVFSPDGRWIAFARGFDSLYVVPATGGRMRFLAVALERIADPDWRPLAGA